MRFPLILIAIAIGLGSQAKAERESGRTCRIVFPERPNDSPKIAYLFNGKESQPVTLPSMNFSEVISLPSGDLTLLLTADAITDPENLPAGAPKLKLAEGIQDFYILITPDRSNSTLPLQMRLVNAGRGKLKTGETLWFNLTDHHIVAKLGEAKMSVKPKSTTVSEDPLPASGYYAAEFAYQPDGEGDYQRITEQQWWHDAASRHVGFMVDTGGRLPRIYFFRDFRLKE
jgi:hypothetical protein